MIAYEPVIPRDGLPPLHIQRVDNGTGYTPVYRIKETEVHYIDLMGMAFNWQIVTTPKRCPLTYDRYWCYVGTGFDVYCRAVLAAYAWDGADDSEPEGWNKNGQTQVLRTDEEIQTMQGS